MDLEHYQKVARVLLKTESVFDLQMKIQAGKKSPELYALVGSGPRATELWKEEFPEGGEFGGQIRLDLSEANLSNSQFRGGTYQGWHSIMQTFDMPG